jgi:hypothetical protein
MVQSSSMRDVSTVNFASGKSGRPNALVTAGRAGGPLPAARREYDAASSARASRRAGDCPPHPLLAKSMPDALCGGHRWQGRAGRPKTPPNLLSEPSPIKVNQGESRWIKVNQGKKNKKLLPKMVRWNRHVRGFPPPRRPLSRALRSRRPLRESLCPS